jgi:ABC-type glycerol-3-phosphate transport system substrate-binding protein
MEHRISRRMFLGGAVGLTGAGFLATACAPMAPGGAQSETPQDAAGSAEGVELIIWDPLFDPQQILLKDLMAKYSALHPEVTFKYESIQYDEVHKKTTIAMAGGGGPDAFNVPSYTWARFIDTKTAVEIDPVAFGAKDMAALRQAMSPTCSTTSRSMINFP